MHYVIYSHPATRNPPRAVLLIALMAPFNVHIKHAGKTYDVQLDPDLPPAAFKDAVYLTTGVPPDRMKVMIKGGMLKVYLGSLV